jgi:hypothetical protein
MKSRSLSQSILISILVMWVLSGCGGTTAQPKSGHWEGETNNGHWLITFDNISGGQISNIGVNYYQSYSSMACSFRITQITVKPNNSFDQDISYADLQSAVGVQGSMSGKFSDASTISGKLTVSMCGRTFYVYEEDMPWTAKWVQP